MNTIDVNTKIENQEEEYEPNEEYDDSEAEDAPPPNTLRRKIQNSTLLRWLTPISRLVLGGIFLLAGLSKLGDFEGFAQSIDDYRMVPVWVQDIMATVLPPIEIALGVFLLMGLFTRISAAITGGLMLMFLIAITQAMFRGLLIDCGCVSTGPNANPISEAVLKMLGPVGEYLTKEKADLQTIVRDLIFLLMAAHLMFVPTVFGLDNLRRVRE